jgi:hypothetical protein
MVGKSESVADRYVRYSDCVHRPLPLRSVSLIQKQSSLQRTVNPTIRFDVRFPTSRMDGARRV